VIYLHVCVFFVQHTILRWEIRGGWEEEEEEEEEEEGY
jgi:hypothetical protein